LNGSSWAAAATINNWTNWTGSLTLTPGTNTVQAYAVDTSGNASVTNKVSTILSISFNLLLTSSSQLILDTTNPTLIVTVPTAGQIMTNPLANVRGTTSDNEKIGGVWFQVNSNTWNLAESTNVWTNWMATIPLVAGTNTVRAYAMDIAGSMSPTSSVSVVSSNAFRLELTPASSQPMTGNGWSFSLQVSPGLNGTIQASTNLVNWAVLDNFVGTNSTINFSDLTATNYNLRFYRAVVQ